MAGDGEEDQHPKTKIVKLAITPKNFCGDGKECPYDFLKQFEECAKNNGWNNDIKMEVVGSFLSPFPLQVIF